MAGQPKRRAMIDELQKRTLAYFDIDPVDVAIGSQSVPSHLDYVTAWIADGRTLKELAFEIGQTLGYEVGRERIGAYLRQQWGDLAETELANARTRASHSLAEDALSLVDAPAEDSVDVQRAASRARARQWTAERYNPREFGSQKGVNVSVSVTSLHLSALQARPTIVTSAPPIEVQSGEVTRAIPTQATE